MINVVVCGAAGRMGRRVIGCLLEEKDLRLGGAVEKPGHPALGKDAVELAGGGRSGVGIVDSLEKALARADVVIDFSDPASSARHAFLAARRKKPIVIGTTGLSPGETEEIRKASAAVPVVFSPNLSVGMNLMFDLAGNVARALGPEYDVEIMEVHHRFKKDAPSGTARKLAQEISDALGRDLKQAARYGRKGQVGERKREEIGIHAVRAGDVVGEHTVIFSNLGERLELTHRAHSRDTFARGALRAARFAASAPPGLYGMADVLRSTAKQK